MKNSNKTVGYLAALLAVVLCCLALGAGIFLSLKSPQILNMLLRRTPTDTPALIRPTARPVTQVAQIQPFKTTPPTIRASQAPGSTEAPTVEDAPTQVILPTPAPVAQIPTDTFSVLSNTVVPISNLADLATRLKGVKDIPATLPPPAEPPKVGDRQTFWVSNTDSHKTFQIAAILRYTTAHLYIWIQDKVRYNSSDVQELADTFENKIYPTDRKFFGSEWSPGVDDDVHLYVVYASGLGASLEGYFSSADEYSPLAYPYSNAHEMFLLNSDVVSLGNPEADKVMSHEFQHMIHWYRDRNEEAWMNEGFSVLAQLLNGYPVGYDDYYMANPDVQLNDWPNDESKVLPHYGAGFLFLDYFLNRFGDQATQDLVADPENGMNSVEDVLKKIHAVDASSGQPISVDDFFADWAVANYVHDPKVGDGRYAYQNYPQVPKVHETEISNSCPTGDNRRSVHQYGADYIGITCPGDHVLHFIGSTETSVLAENPHSGNYAFWSNKGDESDMTLTRKFDFTGLSGPLTFSYWTWYDVEKDFDFVYLEASTDGQNWQIIKTPSSTDKNLSGNSYGWGYNGVSGGGITPQWIQEQVDLSEYAGKQVYLRFEYVTDATTNGEGFMLDDLSIPQAGYSTDFEKDDGGWKGEGFVRIENTLPQTYRLELITKGKTISVSQVSLTSDNTADIPLHIGGDVKEVVLVVSGVTPFTRQTTGYQYSVK